MERFVLEEDRTEKVGGFIWTWRRILNGTLYNTEGIWINTRLIIIQAAQLITFASLSLVSVDEIAASSQKARDDLPDGLPQWVYDFVPTQRMWFDSLA